MASLSEAPRSRRRRAGLASRPWLLPAAALAIALVALLLAIEVYL
jgi:hypothetical protein